MPRAGPNKVRQYSLGFKRQAVALSQLPDVQVQAVAEALEIHPFMLSKWRKEAREGRLRGRAVVAAPPPAPSPATLRRFQALQGAHALLQEEHALLKTLIRFTFARRPTALRSSRRNDGRSV